MSKPQFFTIFSAAASAQRRRKKSPSCITVSYLLPIHSSDRVQPVYLCTPACVCDVVAAGMVSWARAVSRPICHLCRHWYKGPWDMQSSHPPPTHTPTPLLLPPSVSGGDSQSTCHCWSQSQRESWSHTLPFFHSSDWFFNFFSPRPTFLIHRLSQQLSWNNLVNYFASLPLYLSLVFSVFKKTSNKIKNIHRKIPSLEEAMSWQTENQLPILLNTDKIKAETRNFEKLREMSLKVFFFFFRKRV